MVDDKPALSESDSLLILKSLAVGIAGGLFAGLFGVGGGLIMVPLFISWLKLDRKCAHATSLVVIIPLALVASYGYARSDNVSWMSAGALLVGALGGAVLGARYLQVIPKRRLQIIFTIVLLATAVRLLYSDQPSHLLHGNASYLVLAIAGVFAGALSGLLGVGGGIIMIPVLMLATGTSSLIARGTSLVVIVGTALSGALTHHRHALVNSRVAVWTVAGGLPGTAIGVYLSHELSSRVSVIAFATLIICVAILQISELMRANERYQTGGAGGI